MSVRVCTCCSSSQRDSLPLHAHDRPCDIHGLAPVVPAPPQVPWDGGCAGPTVKAAVLAAYRERGGAALELALKMYGEGV